MATQQNPYNRDRYWRALGKFVDQFSEIETGMHLLLWERTRTRMEIAQAVFSGVRIKEAMSLINRVAEVRPLSKEAKADQDYIFAQLRLITDVRNDILHYGAINLQPGELLVTNWLVALTESRKRSILVSSQILLNLTRDLRKIQAHLIEHHLWREAGLPSPLSRSDLRLLNASWKYTPPQQARGRRKIRGATPKQ